MTTWHYVTKVDFDILTVALMVTFNELRMCHIKLCFHRCVISTTSLSTVWDDSHLVLLFSVTGGMDQRERQGMGFIGGLSNSCPVFLTIIYHTFMCWKTRSLKWSSSINFKNKTVRHVSVLNYYIFKKSNIYTSFSVKFQNKSWIMALTQIIDSMLLFLEKKKSKTMLP